MTTREDRLASVLAGAGWLGVTKEQVEQVATALSRHGWHAPGSMDHDEACRSCPRWDSWGLDTWAPIPLRWRHVIAGDVIIGADGRPWMITRRGTNRSLSPDVFAQSGSVEYPGDVDPDEVVHVLVPSGERAALKAAREGLDARIADRSAP